MRHSRALTWREAGRLATRRRRVLNVGDTEPVRAVLRRAVEAWGSATDCGAALRRDRELGADRFARRLEASFTLSEAVDHNELSLAEPLPLSTS